MQDDINPYRSPTEPTAASLPTADDEEVHVLDKVQRYSSGIIVRRWAATWIDFLVIALFLLALDALLGNALYQRLLPLFLFLIALYYPVLEGLEGGTVGKFILGIRVVDYQGQYPGIVKALVRTLFRLVEVNPYLCGGLPAGVVVMLSRRKQRLGDMVARTLVVYQDDLTSS